MNIRKIDYDDWCKEGTERYGVDMRKWEFICPSCGHIASIKEWMDAGAKETQAAFSCIGRHTERPEEIFHKNGGPCNYAGSGLFRLNPVHVKFPDCRVRETFEFAP